MVFVNSVIIFFNWPFRKVLFENFNLSSNTKGERRFGLSLPGLEEDQQHLESSRAGGDSRLGAAGKAKGVEGGGSQWSLISCRHSFKSARVVSVPL